LVIETTCRIPLLLALAEVRTPTSFKHIRVTPMVGSLGAEVADVDLAPVDDAVFEEIHRTWLEHQVLSRTATRDAPHHDQGGRAALA
jgi:hypothetical protein